MNNILGVKNWAGGITQASRGLTQQDLDVHHLLFLCWIGRDRPNVTK